MVENAGFGGAIAAPMAGLCIEQYLYGEIIRYKRAAPVVATQNVPVEQPQANVTE
jgi:hypothetical protein